MTTAQHPPISFAYRWFSRRLLPERRGQRCRIVSYELKTKVGDSVYGAWRGVLVEFEDGLQVHAERGMVKTARGFRETAATRLGERRQYAGHVPVLAPRTGGRRYRDARRDPRRD